MWLDRVVDAVTADPGAVALVGGEAYGAPFVIDALRRGRRVAWVHLPERVRDDPVGQGNLLAEAVNRVATAPLLSQALPYRSHVQTLRHYRHELQPLWLVVSGAGRAPALARDLLPLAEIGYSVLLDVDADDGQLPQTHGRLRVLGPAVLRLTETEAGALAPAGLDAAARDTLYAATGARFTDFVRGAHRRLGLPAVFLPSPDGPRLARADQAVADPRSAVEALRRQQRWLEALDLAVMEAADLVEGLLPRAGPAHQEAGMLPRLHLLLSSLPAAFLSQEATLEWRLMAAVSADDLASVARDVDAYLATYRAPGLRARRAGTLTQQEGFPLACEAVEEQRSPLTLWQYGRLHPDPDRGIALLRESVALAEEMGSRYELARNAGALAARLLYVGDFKQARAWAEWSLQVFDAEGLRDGRRRLTLFNDLAASRILTGDLAGLRTALEAAEASVEGVLPLIAGFFRATLSWLELVSGRAEAAERLARSAYEVAPRASKAWFAVAMVRALNECGRSEEALQVAEGAAALSGEDLSYRRLPGLLARGMARAVAGLEGAEDDLLEVMTERRAAAAEQRLAAALHYLLASGGAAHRVPEDLADMMADLHPAALRVLSGPERAFAGVWATLGGAQAPVRLRFLGGAEAWVRGESVPLPRRLAEITLALVLHPGGITMEALHAFLVGDLEDGPVVATLYAHIRRLRALLPVSGPPYRLSEAFDADLLRLWSHLERNRVRDAVALYQGALLPGSGAPGVREHAALLEEQLRQAAMAAGDPDALFQLADGVADDLELWEATEAALAPGDPRLALARARIRRLGEEYGATAPAGDRGPGAWSSR